jgi:L-serine/L-threonine ammonia-lyase
VAVETRGTASLAASLREGRLVTLETVTGVAKSLGARTVARTALEWAMQHPVRSVVVSDADAIRACVRFADDHRCLVEPACGASLSVVYDRHRGLEQAARIVVVVCGGIGVTLESMLAWRKGRAS